ncbi:MAG: hypothetical protein JST89_22160 [Cyanobacteria bacterium SZAS-4]|nr:hypothetical protein [Cyanobacteria bacterium SZAS-4]
MSGDNKQTTESSGSSMADHLKKYRDYITDLKSGQSSGISAAFGRATDLLPPEVMEIKAPISRNPEEPLELGESVLKPDFDKEYLRQKVESLVQAYANDLEDPVGCTVQTATGIEEVLSVYVENGERMFMLSDLSVIDEETFLRLLVVPERNDEPDSSIEREISAEASDGSVEMEIANDASGDENDWASVLEHLSSVEFVDQSHKVSIPGAINLSVTAPSGALLWQIYYDENGPELVSMADGGIIKRAEGRSEYIFSKLSAADGDIKFFILTGFVVDPNTGNVYLEANEGAYTAAFFNNGWSIHQYRNHAGEEIYYATEPTRPDRAPITAQVRNLNLDLTTGEVSYDTMDSAANITLKSRKL